MSGGVGSMNYGYVVVEVWGDNVTSHWKHRVDDPVIDYVPGGDVFEYSVR